MLKDRLPFKTGIEYLQKKGLDIIMMAGPMKFYFKPGSIFEDKIKETLPKPYAVKNKSEQVFF